MTDPLSTLWQRNCADAAPPTPAELRARADRMRRRIGRRDAIEYAAGAFVIFVFGWVASLVPDWGIRAACGVLILGMFAVMINLWRRRPATDAARRASATQAYYRDLLRDQRDVLNSVWRWYIGPIVPGAVAFPVAVWLATPVHTTIFGAIFGLAMPLLIVGIVFYAVHRLNLAAAKQLDGKLRELDDGNRQEGIE